MYQGLIKVCLKEYRVYFAFAYTHVLIYRRSSIEWEKDLGKPGSPAKSYSSDRNVYRLWLLGESHRSWILLWGRGDVLFVFTVLPVLMASLVRLDDTEVSFRIPVEQSSAFMVAPFDQQESPEARLRWWWWKIIGSPTSSHSLQKHNNANCNWSIWLNEQKFNDMV